MRWRLVGRRGAHALALPPVVNRRKDRARRAPRGGACWRAARRPRAPAAARATAPQTPSAAAAPRRPAHSPRPRPRAPWSTAAPRLRARAARPEPPGAFAACRGPHPTMPPTLSTIFLRSNIQQVRIFIDSNAPRACNFFTSAFPPAHPLDLPGVRCRRCTAGGLIAVVLPNVIHAGHANKARGHARVRAAAPPRRARAAQQRHEPQVRAGAVAQRGDLRARAAPGADRLPGHAPDRAGSRAAGSMQGLQGLHTHM